MVRRLEHVAMDAKPLDLAVATKKLCKLLNECIESGLISTSIRPDWGTGSQFQLLEWLGDSALHFYLTQQIFGLFPAAGATEGAMSEVRANCSTNHCLARVFRNLELVKLLRPPTSSTTTSSPNYLVDEKKCADVVEALLGELYEAWRGCPPAADGVVDAGAQAREAHFALLEVIFYTGLEQTQQRHKPAEVEVSLYITRSPSVVPGQAALDERPRWQRAPQLRL